MYPYYSTCFLIVFEQLTNSNISRGINKVQHMYANKVNCTFLSQIQSGVHKYQLVDDSQHLLELNPSHKSKKIMHAVNTFQTWNGPPKFCIELEADWLIILDEVREKSPGITLQIEKKA